MTSQLLTVAAAAPRVHIAAPEANAREMLALAVENADASVILFPELAITGYTCADLFGQTRLLEASRRWLNWLAKEAWDKGVKGLLAVGAPVPAVPRAAEGRLMLRHREGVSFIDLQDILLVQREDRATVLYTADGGRYVTGDSLAEMEERLHSDAFFRCHKSYIINLNHIKDITPYGRWTYVVRLENTKHDALITHEKYEELERMFR